MGVIYGKNLSVDLDGAREQTVDSFVIEHQGEIPEVAASNTQGGMARVEGNIDWRGRYRLVGHSPIAFPNDAVTLIGTPETTGSKAVSGNARIEKIEITADVANGRYLETIVHFGANGALSYSAAAVADSSSPAPLTSKGLTVNLDGAGQAGLDYWKLTIESKIIRYVNSDTAGQYQRTEGDIDAQLAWRVQTDDSGDFPIINARHVVQCEVTATTHWELTWMRILGVQPWEVDRRERRKPVSAIITAAFTGFSGTMAGTIKNPATATKWPV